jgi:hypothetical protein
MAGTKMGQPMPPPGMGGCHCGGKGTCSHCRANQFAGQKNTVKGEGGKGGKGAKGGY